MTRRTAALALTLLLTLTVAGCSRSRDALTIYSGRTQNLVGPLLERFSQETGIPIDVKYGDSAELALLLAEEGDRTPADVFVSQSPGATGFLAGKGLLGQLDGRLLGKVDQRFRNRGGRWVGVSASGSLGTSGGGGGGGAPRMVSRSQRPRRTGLVRRG